MVADEVRSLSGRAASATEGISRLLDGIRQVSVLIQGACEASMRSAQDSHGLLDASGEQVTRMRRVAHLSSLRAAKSGHRLFVFRVEGDLEREVPSIAPGSLATHHNCGLGTWYEANRSTEIGTLPAFKNLEAPHARLHEQVLQFSTELHAGRRDAALRHIVQVERSLGELLVAMDRLIAEVEEAL